MANLWPIYGQPMGPAERVDFGTRERERKSEILRKTVKSEMF